MNVLTLNLVDETSPTITYHKKLELSAFGIKNDGTSPQETSKGLNQVVQYAKEQGFSRIILPRGTYLIHETTPIVIDLKNAVIDLNGSILQINKNGLLTYSVVQFAEGAENVSLVNGTVRGDRDVHDYTTVKGLHEWGCGIDIKSGNNLFIENVTVTNVTGYGITIENDGTNTAHRYYTLYTNQVTQGSIADDGSIIVSATESRTSKPYDISVCGGEFEVGYTLGYMGYPYLLNKEYMAFFYDADMKFVQKKECLQFRKVTVPTGARYVYFVYPQASIVSNLGVYGWITNLRPPTNTKITNCLIKGNRCLGVAAVGGQKIVIENNIFEENGGAAANHAIDFEDGWELMQDYIVRNNRFINNKHDVTVAAGDNLVFENNEFSTTFWVSERSTNYKVIGNKFAGSSSSSTPFGASATYRIKSTGCEIRDNQYTNCMLATESFSPLTITLNNETLTNTTINQSLGKGTRIINSTLKGTLKPFMKNVSMDNCTIEVSVSEAFNVVLTNCHVKEARWNLHAEHYFENCNLINCLFSTHTDSTRIQLKSCQLLNSQISYNTWGAAVETIIEQCAITINTNLPLIRLSAGKTRNLSFKNNIVVNQATKPVIELYDTTYSIPNGYAILEGNSITMTSYGYVFDGMSISKGIFNLTDRNNTITGAKMLSPKYIGNPYFVITT